MRTRTLIPCVLIAAGLLAGCGSSSSSSTTSASSSSAAAAPPPVPTGIAYEKVPVFEPAKIVAEHVHHAMHVNATAPVSTVATYYARVLPVVGWKIVAKSTSPTQTTFTLSKPGRHASVTISRSGSGSFITILTPPS